ncbi:MAG: XdhC/CoxI family protein [Candidatus Omnitrophota bacterium]
MVKLFNKILETLAQNNSCVLATAVSSRGSSPRKQGAKMIIYKDASIEGTIGGGKLEKTVIADALDALKRKKSVLKIYPLNRKSGLQACGGEISIFLEVLEPDKKIIIAGAGHIGLALSLIAKLLGFEVVIADNRRLFANAGRFPHADKIICAPYEEAFKKTPIDKNTFIVIVTHGCEFDRESLEAALYTKAGYIGMIGSDTKIKLVFSALMKKGFKKDKLALVHTPVGVDIGAETPEEIAVAIAAEIIQVSRESEK